MLLTKEQKELLYDAWDYCDKEGKSTEFMLEYMQDTAKVDLDTVIEFLQKESINVLNYKNGKN